MIYSTVLINAASRRKIASSEYWADPIPRAKINKYLREFNSLIEKSERLKYKPAVLEEFKFFSRECGTGIVIFVTDLHEPDDEIINKINRAAQSLRSILSKEKIGYIKKNYDEIMSQYIYSPLVIAFVGESGVGKTSLLHLLIGKQAPEEHIPTISLNMETLEELRFGSYQILVIDFAGDDQYERMRDFTVIDMFFLITDSSLKNIISAKKMYSQIVKDCPDIPITVIANKQDLANALDPSAISKVMGVEARSMVAVDLAFRNKLLGSLTEVLCNHFDLEVPEIPSEELLSFI